LNFQLDWQTFNGTFDTGNGDCVNCSYDLSNNTCQAEVEKIWGMFNKYNLSMTLNSSRPLNFTNITMVCRDANQTITANPLANCAALFPYPVGPGPCVTWVATPGLSQVIPGNLGLRINLNGFNSTNLQLGYIVPTPTCEQIACEIEGIWKPGNTQEFIMNKTITVTAI
jgi:hypothetical protein